MTHLGSFLEAQRERAACWLKVYYRALLLFIVLNIFLQPHEPHFGLDAWPGFWAVFGFSVGLVMVYAMKRVIQPLITRKEDYYGDV